MFNQNFLKYSAVAAALLGAGLLVSGCGDSGSSTPTTVKKSVTFQYDLEGLAAKTLLPSDVEYIRYQFRDSQQQFLQESKVVHVNHPQVTTSAELTITDVDADASNVMALYYNDKEEIIAIGYNDISWKSTTGTVSNPDVNFNYLTSISDVELVATQLPIDKGETTIVVPLASYKAADATEKVIALPEDLGEFTMAGKDILAHELAHGQSYFKALKYGTETVTFTFDDTSLASLKPSIDIMVTDAKLTSVEIRYMEGVFEKAPSSDLVFLLPDNYSFCFDSVTTADGRVMADKVATMTLVGMYTTDTPGAENYEGALDENVTWKLTGTSATTPEFSGSVNDDNSYTVTANKATTAEVKVNAEFNNGTAFSDVLPISCMAAQAVMNSAIVNKQVIGDKTYPLYDETLKKDTVARNSPKPWDVKIYGAYEFTEGDEIVRTLDTDISTLSPMTASLSMYDSHYELDISGASLVFDKDAKCYKWTAPSSGIAETYSADLTFKINDGKLSDVLEMVVVKI